MKKQLITLATATAMTAPAAVLADSHDSHSPEIYGQVHMSMNHIDNDDTEGEDSALNISSNSSRFGIRGSEEIQPGLTGIYQLELGVHWGGQGSDKTSTTGDDSIWRQVRDSYVGLEGDFGTLRAGRLPAANQYIYDANFFINTIGDPGGLTGFDIAGNAGIGGRYSSAVQYTAPMVGPLGASVTVAPSNNGADEHSMILRGTYEEGPFFGAVNYISKPDATVEDPEDDDITSQHDLQFLVLSGGYEQNGLRVAGLYGLVLDDDDLTDGAPEIDGEDSFFSLGASFDITAQGTVKGQYTAYMADEGSEGDSNLFAIGYDHALSDRTTAYAVYAHMDNDEMASRGVDGYGHGGGPDDLAGPNNDADPNAFSVGVTHNF
ncbi:porin [Halorhodospira halophila]|uniref:Porin, Gram-negative type n=1 Tax=Halorhodospira halophila (strain DSM 244 / SL1) TaxID=349124 RepID=A1WYQ2_HALHL|nr:porin [Halorhodospira halophila]ABM62814.1 porin, Gram-negative type [Halorhodospira halophila SL1]MBK1728063.1 porin [Halorhodospira halophila]